MRSHVADGLMGIGVIFLAFGGVTAVISFAARQADAQRNITTMHMTTLESVGGGAILLGLGFLLRRSAQKTADSPER